MIIDRSEIKKRITSRRTRSKRVQPVEEGRLDGSFLDPSERRLCFHSDGELL